MRTLMQDMRRLLSRCRAAPQQSKSSRVGQPQTSEGRQPHEEMVFGGDVLRVDVSVRIGSPSQRQRHQTGWERKLAHTVQEGLGTQSAKEGQHLAARKNRDRTRR
jgi:hypothetical protein